MAPMTRIQEAEGARLLACRRCQRFVLTASVEPRGRGTAMLEGLPTRCDLTPLDRVTEVVVLMLGRPTFEVHRVGRLDRLPILLWRTPERIAAREWPLAVLAEHRCRTGPHTTLPEWYLGIAPVTEQSDTPPF
jgi:hypothetical protein